MVDVGHRSYPGEPHGEGEITAQDVEDLGDSGLSTAGQAPQLGPANEDRSRPQCQRAQHVGSSPDSSVQTPIRWPTASTTSGRASSAAGFAVELTTSVVDTDTAAGPASAARAASCQ
jgi:hypothetical protein